MKVKSLLNSYLENFNYFYNYFKLRMFVAIVLSIMVGVLDGFGLAMFLPMLEMLDGQQASSPDSMGNLSFLPEMINDFGLAFNLKTTLILILIFFSLKGVARFFEQYYKVYLQEFFVRRLRIDNIQGLAEYKYKAFIKADAGRIQNTLSGETERVVGAYRAYVNTLQSIAMLSVYAFMAYLANPQFALLVTLGGLLSNLIFRTIYKRTAILSKRITNYAHEYQGLLIQKVAFFKYLKATGSVFTFSEKLKQLIGLIEKSNRKIGLYGSVLMAIREPIVILIVVSVIFVQVTFFAQKLGLIILSLLFFYRALTFVLNIQNEWNKFLTVSGSMDNMKNFQKTMALNQDVDGNKHLTKFENVIEFDRVTFSYESNVVLKEISLELSRNKTYAFVGESGSGKTTLINLVSGLMPLQEGEIRVDGIPFSDLNIASLQNRVGYITQEPVIFTASVYDNVTFWSERTPENIQRFWRALKKASVKEFVESLANKEYEELGDNGVNLSGGQKQRISIARELYKEVDILIMDEATSALDSETENSIQRNIDELKGAYTILIVAHRLSTIKSADCVFLLKGGKIAAKGEFEHLLNSSQEFERMVSFQTI